MELMLDTNVVLDHVGKREPFTDIARKICLLGIAKEANLYISTSMITDLAYLLRKDHGSIGSQKLIEDTLSFLQPISCSPEDVKQALFEKWDDFEDCLVAQCAKKIKADYIITRNTKDFSRSAVPSITPEDLFAILEKQGFTYEEIAF